jgi:hypothetical protein
MLIRLSVSLFKDASALLTLLVTVLLGFNHILFASFAIASSCFVDFIQTLPNNQTVFSHFAALSASTDGVIFGCTNHSNHFLDFTFAIAQNSHCVPAQIAVSVGVAILHSDNNVLACVHNHHTIAFLPALAKNVDHHSVGVGMREFTQTTFQTVFHICAAGVVVSIQKGVVITHFH